MRKIYLFLAIIIFILVFIYVNNNFIVSSINLENENLAGIHLLQQADIPLLEKEFGKLTSGNTFDKWGGSLTFDNPPYYTLVQVDKDNHVTKISIACSNRTSNAKFVTSKNVGSRSTISDIEKAYGKEYYKKTYRNFMGSGDGYSITYVDREHDIAIEFEFNDNPFDDKKEEELIRIELRRQVDKEISNGLF